MLDHAIGVAIPGRSDEVLLFGRLHFLRSDSLRGYRVSKAKPVDAKLGSLDAMLPAHGPRLAVIGCFDRDEHAER